MALNPRFAGQRLAAVSALQAPHSLELFLDYVCPYSKKMFDMIYDQVFPVVKNKYSDKLEIIFRQQIQPWHPSSTLVHEAGVAVLQTNPGKFWEFSKALFAVQTDYFDLNVVNETRNQTYERLAKLAGSVGLDQAKIYSLLEVSPKKGKEEWLNIGNEVSNDIKVLVKVNRRLGTHTTPTVLFNGVEETSISSSFTKDQWEGWLAKNVV